MIKFLGCILWSLILPVMSLATAEQPPSSVVKQIRMTIEYYTYNLDSPKAAGELLDSLLNQRGKQVLPPENFGRLPSLDLPNFYCAIAEYYWLGDNGKPLVSAKVYRQIDNGSGQELLPGYTEYLLYTDGLWFNLPTEVWNKFDALSFSYNWEQDAEYYKPYALVINGRPLNYAVYVAGDDMLFSADLDSVAFYFEIIQSCFAQEIAKPSLKKYTEKFKLGFFAEYPLDNNGLKQPILLFTIYTPADGKANQCLLYDVKKDKYYEISAGNQDLLTVCFEAER